VVDKAVGVVRARVCADVRGAREKQVDGEWRRSGKSSSRRLFFGKQMQK